MITMIILMDYDLQFVNQVNQVNQVNSVNYVNPVHPVHPDNPVNPAILFINAPSTPCTVF